MVPCASCMQIGQDWGFDKRNVTTNGQKFGETKSPLSTREVRDDRTYPWVSAW